MRNLLQIQEIREKNKKSVVAFMQANGIERAVIEFDGSGDSGQTEPAVIIPNSKQELVYEEITFITFSQRFSGGEWNVEATEKQASVEEALEDLAYCALENNHGGWEINEGAYGEITIEADGSGRIEYNQRIETIECEETSF
jgi:hypothetical protein